MKFIIGLLGVGLPYFVIGALLGSLATAFFAYHNNFFGVREIKKPPKRK